MAIGTCRIGLYCSSDAHPDNSGYIGIKVDCVGNGLPLSWCRQFGWSYLNKTPLQLRDQLGAEFPAAFWNTALASPDPRTGLVWVYRHLIAPRSWTLRKIRYGHTRWHLSGNDTNIGLDVSGARGKGRTKMPWSLAFSQGQDSGGGATNAQDTVRVYLTLDGYIKDIDIVAGDSPTTVATKVYDAMVSLGVPDVTRIGATVTWDKRPDDDLCSEFHLDPISGLDHELQLAQDVGLIDEPQHS